GVRLAHHQHEGRPSAARRAPHRAPRRSRRRVGRTGGLVMSALQTLRVALRALLRNKLRSFLTTLGIVIGVGAVIAMVAIGEGAKARVEQSFQSVGSNLLVIMNGSTRTGGAMGGFGSMPSLTWEDLRAI